LNLTFEVRNGIVKHSKGRGDILPKDKSELAVTMEGRVVRVADIIAYINHDMDDALRAGILKEGTLPDKIQRVVGDRHSKRIEAMVRDLIVETLTADDGELHISDIMLEAITNLRTFLYDNVYTYFKVHAEFEKAQRIIRDLYGYFMENGLVRLRGGEWETEDKGEEWADEKIAHRRVCDYVAGMTDRYALAIYERIFLPEPWRVK
jgi:dGTPase